MSSSVNIQDGGMEEGRVNRGGGVLCLLFALVSCHARPLHHVSQDQGGCDHAISPYYIMHSTSFQSI